MPVVDVDFNVVGAGAARGDEEAARVAADFGGGGPEGGVSEADVEEAGRGKARVSFFFFEGGLGIGGWGALHSQACDGVAVWIGGCVVRDRLDDSRGVHVYCEERSTKGGVLRVDGVHVVDCADEGGDVDLVEIQAPDAVQVALYAGEGVDAESGRGLNVFPGDHGDVLFKRPEVYQWLDER